MEALKSNFEIKFYNLSLEVRYFRLEDRKNDGPTSTTYAYIWRVFFIS